MSRLRAVLATVAIAGVLGVLGSASPAGAQVPANTPQACYPGELCFTRYPWSPPHGGSVWAYVRQFGVSVPDYRTHPWWWTNHGWVTTKVENSASDFLNNNRDCDVRVFRGWNYDGKSSRFGNVRQQPHWRHLGDFTIGDDTASSHLECPWV
jgi:hypothetical protein